MTNNNFYKSLTLTSILSAVVILVFYQFELFKQDVILYVISLVFMIIYTVVFYLSALKALKSTNKMAFIQLVMANVFLKLVFLMAIVAIYNKLATPPSSKFFVIPFLIIYAIFTVYETAFVYKLSNNTNPIS